jgi:hypothetical protein
LYQHSFAGTLNLMNTSKCDVVLYQLVIHVNNISFLMFPNSTVYRSLLKSLNESEETRTFFPYRENCDWSGPRCRFSIGLLINDFTFKKVGVLASNKTQQNYGIYVSKCGHYIYFEKKGNNHINILLREKINKTKINRQKIFRKRV